MIAALREILEGAIQRLSVQAHNYLPSLLAAVIILLGAYLVAVIVRWVLARIFKGIELDRFLLRSGIASTLGRSGHLPAAQIVSRLAYWAILAVGVLAGLNAFDTQLTSNMIEGVLTLFPKFLTAGLIVLAGVWLGQYFSRSTLLWAVNEDMPSPRRMAAAVRILVIFVAVVVAADHLNFGRNVFLAAFILLAGGAVLALSIALGLSARDALRAYFQGKMELDHKEPEEKRSLWSHL